MKIISIYIKLIIYIYIYSSNPLTPYVISCILNNFVLDNEPTTNPNEFIKSIQVSNFEMYKYKNIYIFIYNIQLDPIQINQRQFNIQY